MLKVIKVIGFSVFNMCELTIAISCEIPRLAQMYTFPRQMMNLRFVLIRASSILSLTNYMDLSQCN